MKIQQFSNAEDLLKYKNEVVLLFTLRHEHVIDVIDFNFELFPKQKNPYFLYLVMELANETVADLIKKNALNFKDIEILQILYDMVEALNFSNSLNIPHSDVKPNNIARVGSIYKLLDWGAATLTDDPEKISGTIKKVPAKELELSILYVSPDFYRT